MQPPSTPAAPLVDMLDFSGRSVLVIGGSSGIGNGIARAFMAAGATVTVTGTRPDASSYRGEPGSDLEGLAYRCLDLARPAAVSEISDFADGLDVLVLSQGTVIYKRGEFEPDGWDRVMSINLDSLMRCATHFRPALAAKGGSLIIVSSVSAFHANIGNPAYAASKAGAVSLTKTLASAWAREGIRVNGLAPGLVETKLTRATTEHPQRKEAALASIPAGRLGTPEEMAGAALFLASPLASYVYGHTLVVDGGLLIH